MSFASIILDEAFPLFCMSTVGGLDVTERNIGKILSGAGLIFVLFQYPWYSFIMGRYGLYASQLIGTILATPISILIPISLYLNRGVSEPHELSWSAYIFLCVVYGVKNVSNNVAFSSVSVATNRSVSSSERATVNGISQLGGSITKASGPIVAGFLVSFLLGGRIVGTKTGVYSLFGIISVIGVLCVYIVTILKKYYKGGSLHVNKK